MNTALVLRIPEAEPVVSRWRALHDPSAAEGMPAHVTLVYPFRPKEEIDAEAEASLTHLFAQALPFDLHFIETRRFPAVLWLAPENPAHVVALVRALGLAFPEHMPYAGAHPDTVPHLTLAHLKTHDATEADLDRIEREFLAGAKAHLPLHARIESASLFCRQPDGGWREMRKFPLSARA